MRADTQRFLRILVVVWALVGAFFLWASQALVDLDRVRYERASDQIRAGQYLEAAETYKMILETTTDLELKAKVQELLGDLYALYLEVPDQAKEVYEAVLRDYPESPWVDDALFNIGMIHFEKGEWAEAREEFREVLREYPDSPRAFTAETLYEQAEEYILDPSKAPKPAPAPEPEQVAAQMIRVLVVDFATEATITASSPMSLVCCHGSSLDSKDSGNTEVNVGKAVRVTAQSGQFVVNGRRTAKGDIILSCADQSLRIADRTFRGELVFHARDDGFFVVNWLPLEAYLRGVIAKEMPAVWNIEALKAQAVAARTYAVFQIDKHQNEQWDVMATVMSQVYGGRDAETESTDRAVHETMGQILTYKQRPILAYFHASSGGYTETTTDVWGIWLPYLEAVPDPYSTGIPTDKWKAAFTLDQISSALQADGIIGILDFAPAEHSQAGRVTRIRFETSSGVKELPANTTRLRLGSTVMKSTWWRVARQGDRWVFQGRGYGHGVGLSQWGAKAMADQGYDYIQILKYYYPKCSVTPALDTDPGNGS